MRNLATALLLFWSNCWANDELASAALARTEAVVTYDGRYKAIDYPGGDVPSNIGVCTDVVIRSYRAIGTDLQRLVHEDMSGNFDAYPKIWGLPKPDSNIDHRRVPNLETFFVRNGKSLPLDHAVSNHKPGDIISWRLANGLPHIGIVGPHIVPGTERYYIVHNIGLGPKKEDVLTRYELHGHFRYAPSQEPP
ncbi:MAG: DUF1287 domain-containing protein [Pseudomonadales bacterium]